MISNNNKKTSKWILKFFFLFFDDDAPSQKYLWYQIKSGLLKKNLLESLKEDKSNWC
jgi:hypothetical protein